MKQQKNVITVLVEHWYNMFFARKSANSLAGKTDTLFSTTTFFLLNISINKTGVRYQSVFASSFQKCNWIVKIVFWSSID